MTVDVYLKDGTIQTFKDENKTITAHGWLRMWDQYGETLFPPTSILYVEVTNTEKTNG